MKKSKERLQAEWGLRAMEVGITNALREALQQYGAVSIEQLVTLTGFPHKRIGTLLAQMTGAAGGSVRLGRGLYGPSRELTATAGEFAKTARIEHEFKPLKRDPFAHQKLAMAGRR